MQVKFDEKTCQMELPDEYQLMDYGMDLYAPQSTRDEEGRRIPDCVASHAGSRWMEMEGNDVYSKSCRSERESHLFSCPSEYSGSIYKEKSPHRMKQMKADIV